MPAATTTLRCPIAAPLSARLVPYRPLLLFRCTLQHQGLPADHYRRLKQVGSRLARLNHKRRAERALRAEGSKSLGPRAQPSCVHAAAMLANLQREPQSSDAESKHIRFITFSSQ
jgi:hypothetical protein